MSSTRTYYGIVLVLDWGEMDALRTKYCRQHFQGEDVEDAIDQFNELMWCDRELERSSPTEENPTCSFMALEQDDCYDGIVFAPWAGRWNGTQTDEVWFQEDVYCLMADHQLDRQSIFAWSPYRNMDDLVAEFKEKVGGYLPADFDYAGHIGFLAYSATC